MPHVAELNFGRLRYNWEDARVAPFVEALERVNAIAARSPGFVWMLDSEAMEAEQLRPDGVFRGDPRVASTLSVWESVSALRRFAFETLHARFLKRGPEWFEPPDGPNFVMWRVAPGVRPTLADAMARLDKLGKDGASADAFDWAWVDEGGLAETKEDMT